MTCLDSPPARNDSRNERSIEIGRCSVNQESKRVKWNWNEVEAIPLADRYGFANIHEMLEHAAREWGAQPALTFQLTPAPDAPAYSVDFSSYCQEVTRAANLFRSLGVGRDDGIGLLLPNLPETAYALLGAMTAGVAVPINPLLFSGADCGNPSGFARPGSRDACAVPEDRSRREGGCRSRAGSRCWVAGGDRHASLRTAAEVLAGPVPSASPARRPQCANRVLRPRPGRHIQAKA